jgi:hypothetical protein
MVNIWDSVIKWYRIAQYLKFVQVAGPREVKKSKTIRSQNRVKNTRRSLQPSGELCVGAQALFNSRHYGHCRLDILLDRSCRLDLGLAQPQQRPSIVDSRISGAMYRSRVPPSWRRRRLRRDVLKKNLACGMSACAYNEGKAWTAAVVPRITSPTRPVVDK